MRKVFANNETSGGAMAERLPWPLLSDFKAIYQDEDTELKSRALYKYTVPFISLTAPL